MSDSYIWPVTSVPARSILWSSGKILLRRRKEKRRKGAAEGGKERIEKLHTQKEEKQEIQIIQIYTVEVALLSNDWYYPVFNQTWAEQNLWWENRDMMTDLMKYVVEEIIRVFALNPLMALKELLSAKTN